MHRYGAFQDLLPAVGRTGLHAAGAPALGVLGRLFLGGQPLTHAVWERRHRGLVLLLWLHAAVIATYGALGAPIAIHSLAEGGVIALAAVLAGMSRLNRQARAGAAGFGLVTATAALVQISGGFVEAHVNAFVVVALMALCQGRVPFFLAVLHVALRYGGLDAFRAMGTARADGPGRYAVFGEVADDVRATTTDREAPRTGDVARPAPRFHEWPVAVSWERRTEPVEALAS